MRWGVALIIFTLLQELQEAIFQADRYFFIPILIPFAPICFAILLAS
jgi:hypothetical protein